MKPKNKNGFTLIELLVVISIIGLLASVVLVSLNKARIKARDTRRLADLKQIMTALEMYVSDIGYYPNTKSTTAAVWACFDCSGSAYSQAIYDASGNTQVATDIRAALSPYLKNAADPKNTHIGPYVGYIYASDGNNYKLLAHGSVEDLRDFPAGMIDSVRCGGFDPNTGICNVTGTNGAQVQTVGFWTSNNAQIW